MNTVPTGARYIKVPTASSKLPQDELSRLLLSFTTTSSETMIITDADIDNIDGPCIQFANPAALSYTGYTVDSLIGRRLAVLYAPETMLQILEDMHAALRTAQSITRELPVLSAQGRVHWVEIDSVPVADAAGRITHFIRAGRNVTARKRAEMQRENSERLLASVLGVAREAMVVIAASGHIALANAAFSRRFGWNAADLDGKSCQDTLIDNDADRIMGQIANEVSGPVREVAANIRQKDGTTVPCLLLVNTVQQPDNRLYYVLIAIPDAATEATDSTSPTHGLGEPVHEIVHDGTGGPSSFCLLHPPHGLRQRMEKARGVVANDSGKVVDTDLLMLRWAAEAAEREHAAGGSRYFGIPIDYGVFDSKARTDAFLDACKKLTAHQHTRIVVILRHVPPHTYRDRIGSVAQLLKPYTRYIGFEFVELGGKLTGAPHNAGLVAIAEDRLQDDSRLMERLDKIVAQFHMEGTKVLIHRVPNRIDFSKFTDAGVDFIACDGDTP